MLITSQTSMFKVLILHVMTIYQIHSLPFLILGLGANPPPSAIQTSLTLLKSSLTLKKPLISSIKNCVCLGMCPRVLHKRPSSW